MKIVSEDEMTKFEKEYRWIRIDGKKQEMMVYSIDDKKYIYKINKVTYDSDNDTCVRHVLGGIDENITLHDDDILVEQYKGKYDVYEKVEE